MIRHILAARTDLFGEFLLGIPAMRALKESFPGARLTAVVTPSVAPIARCVPFIDEVIEAPPLQPSWRTRLAWARRLRGLGVDAAVMFNASREFNWISFLAGIPVRLGYDRKSAFLLTHRIPDAKPLGLRHELESNLLLAAVIGARTKNMALELNIPVEAVSPTVRAVPERGAGPLAAVHPFTSNPSKQWPADRFALTVLRLLSAGIRVVLVGRTGDAAYRQTFAEAFTRGCVDMVNATTLPELAYLLGRCAVLVSCDSGPVHLASCVGTPSVAIFHSDIPGKVRRWGPVAPGSVVIARPRLEELTVEDVIAGVSAAGIRIEEREQIPSG